MPGIMYIGMLHVRCADGAGFAGYNGGLHGLVRNLNLQSAHFFSRATSFGILHVGGKHSSTDVSTNQYYPKKFAVPIAMSALQGGATGVAMLMSEERKRGAPVAGLIGDWKDLKAYLAVYMKKAEHNALYYYHWLCDTNPVPVKCFFDLDLYLPGSDQSASWETLNEMIKTVLTALNKNVETPDYELAVVGGVRAGRPGTKHAMDHKHSYHVTFPNHIFDTMLSHKKFMKSLFQHEVKYDPSVYSNGRCFRIPWTPKGGRDGNDMEACLIPLRPSQSSKAELGEWEPCNHHFDSSFFDVMDIVPRQPISTYIMHTVELRTNIDRPLTSATIRTSGESYNRSNAMLAFFRPLMDVLMDKIQRHRRCLRAGKTNADRRAGVPVGESLSFADPVYSGKEGIWQVKVYNDTFCEHDHPSHFHSSGDKICLSVNLMSGYYNQLCYACNPQGNDIKKYGLFDMNGFCVAEIDALSSPLLDIQGKFGVVLFLQSIAKNVLYHPSFGSTVYVYHEESKLWVSDLDAMRILTKHRNDYRDRYNNYCKSARHSAVIEEMKNATEKQAKQIMAAYAALCMKDPNKDLSNTMFMESLVGNYSTAFPNPVEGKDILNHIPHLVPMNDGMCFNVFTGETVPRTQEMRFTNMLNTCRKLTEDDECLSVRAWFKEISRGRIDLAIYLLRLMGYCATMLIGDRHFYVNTGMGRNGKGALHRFLKVHS